MSTNMPRVSYLDDDDDDNDDKSEHTIKRLMEYARTNYQVNPTDSLAALLEAMTLNTGSRQAADATMNRLRNELGDSVVEAVQDSAERTRRARVMVETLLQDSSTFLYHQGRQDLIRQTMENGSSVVCTNCQAVIASHRWSQHQLYWCTSTHHNIATNSNTTTAQIAAEDATMY
jgi:hypothetical protein